MERKVKNPRGAPENLTKKGCNWGNKGGTGRPPSALRASMRDILEKKGLNKLEDIVSGKEDGASPGESIRAIEVCARYGLGEVKAVVPDEMLKAVATVAAEFLEPEQMEPFTTRLIEVLQEAL